MGLSPYIVWLVVSNTAFIFHDIWDAILPIDFHIFQDGFSTTNQMIRGYTYLVYWVLDPHFA
jgi:hypothetical protein